MGKGGKARHRHDAPPLAVSVYWRHVIGGCRHSLEKKDIFNWEPIWGMNQPHINTWPMKQSGTHTHKRTHIREIREKESVSVAAIPQWVLRRILQSTNKCFLSLSLSTPRHTLSISVIFAIYSYMWIYTYIIEYLSVRLLVYTCQASSIYLHLHTNDFPGVFCPWMLFDFLPSVTGANLETSPSHVSHSRLLCFLQKGKHSVPVVWRQVKKSEDTS